MDTEQIEQSLRATRYAIDDKLDRIGARMRETRQRVLPLAIGAFALVLGGLTWRRYLRRTAARRLRLVA